MAYHPLHNDTAANAGASASASDVERGMQDKFSYQNNTERLARSTEMLRQAQQTASDTEAIGAATLSTLADQRLQIVRMGQTLGDTDTSLSRSRRTLDAIVRRATTNKCLLYAIITMLVVIAIGVLLIKLNK